MEIVDKIESFFIASFKHRWSRLLNARSFCVADQVKIVSKRIEREEYK